MKKYIKLTIFLLAPLFLICCNDDRTHQIRKHVKEIKGSRVQWPDTFRVKDLKNDHFYTAEESNQFVHNNSYKVATCIDGTCHSCIKQLIGWKTVIERFCGENVRFLFMIHADNFSRFELFNIQSINFEYPVIYDYENAFQSKNKILDDHLLNTVLVNPKGRIVVVGNPIYSDELLKIYLESI